MKYFNRPDSENAGTGAHLDRGAASLPPATIEYDFARRLAESGRRLGLTLPGDIDFTDLDLRAVPDNPHWYSLVKGKRTLRSDPSQKGGHVFETVIDCCPPAMYFCIPDDVEQAKLDPSRAV